MSKKSKKPKLTKKQFNFIYYGVIIAAIGFMLTMAYIELKPVIDWNNSRRDNSTLSN